MTNITKEIMRTIQNQGRMDALMLSIEGEASALASEFGTNCRLILPLLDGVLHLRRDSQIDSIANLNTLMGKENQTFKDQVQDARNVISNALEFLKDVEGIEVLS